jgi:hypothetical protein
VDAPRSNTLRVFRSGAFGALAHPEVFARDSADLDSLWLITRCVLSRRRKRIAENDKGTWAIDHRHFTCLTGTARHSAAI